MMNEGWNTLSAPKCAHNRLCVGRLSMYYPKKLGSWPIRWIDRRGKRGWHGFCRASNGNQQNAHVKESGHKRSMEQQGGIHEQFAITVRCSRLALVNVRRRDRHQCQFVS